MGACADDGWRSSARLAVGAFLVNLLCAAAVAVGANNAGETSPGKPAGDIVISSKTIKSNIDTIGFKGAPYMRAESTYLKPFREAMWKKKMTALMKEYGFRSFRFHYPPISHWKEPVAKWGRLVTQRYLENLEDVITEKEFFGWLKDNDFRGIIQLNIFNYYDAEKDKILPLKTHPEYISRAADEALELVQWAYENGYDKYVYYWELGNESYGAFPPLLAAKIDYEFIKRLKKFDPDIKIAVDGQSPEHPRPIKHDNWRGSVGSWHREFLTELVRLGATSSDIAYVSQHCYAHWIEDLPLKSPEAIPPVEDTWRILKKPVVTYIGSIDANAKLLDSLGLKDTYIQVNEFKRGASHMYYNRTMMHALAQADPLFHFVKHPRVKGAVIHDLFNNGHAPLMDEPWKLRVGGWAIFLVLKDGYLSSPVAEMFKLTDMLLADGDDIVESSGGSASLAAYGQGKLKFIVVNKEDDDYTARIVLDGFKVSPGAKVSVYTLSSDHLDDFPIHPITKAFKDIKVERQPTFEISGGPFECEIRKYSFTYVEIDGVVDRP